MHGMLQSQRQRKPHLGAAGAHHAPRDLVTLCSHAHSCGSPGSAVADDWQLLQWAGGQRGRLCAG